MQRTRRYYLALGYDNPYKWAQFEHVPFAHMRKALSKTKIGLVTTAAPYRHDLGDQGPGAPYNGSAKFFDVYARSIGGEPDVRISHIAYDRTHTKGEDINTWFPLKALKKAATAGSIGSISKRFYGLPTNRSHSTTKEKDCPALLNLLREDDVDAAILVPNCPVCHQSCSFAANHLEEAGIPTVIMGCASDIVEHAGVPRFLFSDFPLGNSAGKPHDLGSQERSLAHALALLESASKPRTTQQSPIIWSIDDDWKQDYSNPDKLSADELSRRRSEFDAQKKAVPSTKKY
ncbi:MAG: glycine/sarcosine/betaine reductase selenoprotein B family protein [Hyphomicrobiales bacterium]